MGHSLSPFILSWLSYHVAASEATISHTFVRWQVKNKQEVLSTQQPDCFAFHTFYPVKQDGKVENDLKFHFARRCRETEILFLHCT